MLFTAATARDFTKWTKTNMWIIAIAWMYVALMMSMAEATSADGTVLGAIVTFVFYGLAPMALVMYLLSTPARRRALRQREAQEAQQAQKHAKQMSIDEAGGPDAAVVMTATVASENVDGGGLPASDAIAPERKEP
jgi:uncharacterized membrane protein